MTTTTAPTRSPASEASAWPLIGDSKTVLSAARRLAWPCARSIDDALRAEDHAELTLLIATRAETLDDPRLPELLAGTRTLYLGLQAFDPAPNAVAYSLAMLTASDFSGAVRRNRRWVRILERRRELRFRSGRRAAFLSCIPAAEIEAGSCLSLALPLGSIVSIGACFEVELEGFAESSRPFDVDGEIVADGALFALADDFAGDRATAMARGHRVFAAANQGPLRLRIEGSHLVDCRGDDGRSRLAEVAAALDGQLQLTEFAIGTNRLPAPDFSINAQINEGSGGIHVGLGGGELGLHLDFVAHSARPIPEGALPAEGRACAPSTI